MSDRWATVAGEPIQKQHYFAPGSWDSICGLVWLAPSLRGTLGPEPEDAKRDGCVFCQQALLKRAREAS